MPTREELTRQQEVLTKALESVETNLMPFVGTDAERFLKETGEKKLSKVKEKTFSELYDPVYKQVKDVQFSIGSDVATANTADKAFYLFNAADFAERTAQAKMEETTKANLAFEEQQKRIKAFAEEQDKLKTRSVFDMYFQDVLKNEEDAVKGYITSDNPAFDWKAYVASPTRTSRFVTAFDARGNRSQKVLYSYKNQEAAATHLKALRSVYEQRFQTDQQLQSQYTDKYKKNLLAQQAQIKQQLARMK